MRLLIPVKCCYLILIDLTGCAFIYVRSAAPNRRSLGATNGLAQTCISVVRAIGPALSSSLYAVSVQRNIFGGWFVYIVLIIASALALLGSAYLPKKLWEVEEDEE